MPHGNARMCRGCWDQLRVPVPLRGPLSFPLRIFGIRPSRMNPDTCTVCELGFKTVMRARKVTIDATVLFADLRGYTALSTSLSGDAISGVLDDFYDECGAAIWNHDGLLNKTIGDAVMAVFNFPIKNDGHARQAVLAARDIQRRWTIRRSGLAATLGVAGTELGVGIGIQTGELSFGEFGRTHRDVTAIGTVVNTAARAQTAAEAGQILVTSAVRDRAPEELAGARAGAYKLKGFDEPMELYAA